MKMNTKMWIALGILCAYIIFAIVMVYMNPTGLIFGVLSFLAGGFAGYFLKSGVLQNKMEKTKKLLNEKSE